MAVESLSLYLKLHSIYLVDICTWDTIIFPCKKIFWLMVYSHYVTTIKPTTIPARSLEPVITSLVLILSTPFFAGNKSFKCPECTAEIQHYYNLICHIATAHYKDQLKKMQGSENRKCTLCSDMFNSKRQLIRHLVSYVKTNKGSEHQVWDSPSSTKCLHYLRKIEVC